MNKKNKKESQAHGERHALQVYEGRIAYDARIGMEYSERNDIKKEV
jgi:hypothetical protein